MVATPLPLWLYLGKTSTKGVPFVGLLFERNFVTHRFLLETYAILIGAVHLLDILLRFALKLSQKVLQVLHVFALSPASRRRAPAEKLLQRNFSTSCLNLCL